MPRAALPPPVSVVPAEVLYDGIDLGTILMFVGYEFVLQAIILTPLLGNAAAVSPNGTPWLTWPAPAASIAIAVVMLGIQTRRIRVDEVL